MMRPVLSRFVFVSWGCVGSQFLTPRHQSSWPCKPLDNDERRVIPRLIVVGFVLFPIFCKIFYVLQP